MEEKAALLPLPKSRSAQFAISFRSGDSTTGYATLILIIDGHLAQVFEPNQTLLDAGIVILLDDTGHWQNTVTSKVTAWASPTPGEDRRSSLIAGSLGEDFAQEPDRQMEMTMAALAFPHRSGSCSSVSRLKYKTLESAKLTGARIGRYHEVIVGLLTGRAAQNRFKPGSCRAFHSANDLDSVSRLLLYLHPEPEEQKHVFRYLEARARNFVSHSQNWRMIQDLAKTLVERRTMSGQEAEATLRTSMAAQLAEAQAKGKKGRVATAHR